jgi:hypothetical protein
MAGVDQRVHDEQQGQCDPQAQEDLNATRRPRGQLGAVIFVTQIMAVLLSLGPGVLLRHDGRTLPQGSWIVKPPIRSFDGPC